MVRQIIDFSLYRWRFYIGYAIIALAGLLLLGLALFVAPGGISQAEKQSVITTGAFSFRSMTPSTVIDAPYHILQWLSIRTLGLSDFSIKLPSAALAIMTVVGITGLLIAWFRRNVAVLAAIIVVTTGQFLFAAQDGTAGIMMIFWPVWILYGAIHVSRRKTFGTFWKIFLFGAMALSLYTPLSIYMLLAACSATIFHPHLRFLIRTMQKWKVLIALIFSLGLITPLIYAITLDHKIAYTLIGLPSTTPNWFNNLHVLAHEYVNVIRPSGGIIPTPVYGFGSLALAVLGILRFFTTKYTARGYILTAWIVLLIPILLADPLVVDVTFVPMTFLIAMGIDWLFRHWYSLFPRNPYARIAGLVPLMVLLSGIAISGVTHYTSNMLHNPAQADLFTQDLTLAKNQIATEKKDPILLVVKPADQPFYQMIAKYNNRVAVTTSMPSDVTEPTLVAHGVEQTPRTDKLTRIITDSHGENADRFYLYKK